MSNRRHAVAAVLRAAFDSARRQGAVTRGEGMRGRVANARLFGLHLSFERAVRAGCGSCSASLAGQTFIVRLTRNGVGRVRQAIPAQRKRREVLVPLALREARWRIGDNLRVDPLVIRDVVGVRPPPRRSRAGREALRLAHMRVGPLVAH